MSRQDHLALKPIACLLLHMSDTIRQILNTHRKKFPFLSAHVMYMTDRLFQIKFPFRILPWDDKYLYSTFPLICSQKATWSL